MPAGVHPRGEDLVPVSVRSLAFIVLMLISAGCAYLSLAVPEAPREYWWIFWTIYAVVGLSCLLGAGWLVRMRRTGA
jgi:hypothetical protein